MNSKRMLRETREGAVLPLVIFAVVLLVTVGVGMLGLSLHSRMLAVRSAADIAARCAADAALATAIFQMNEKLKVKPWDESTLPAASNVDLLNCEATFDYSVSNNSGTYTIQGTGRAGNAVRTVNSTLRLRSPFDFAVFARDYLELKNGTIVDWYNNQPGDRPLQVGTSSIDDDTVILKNGTTINGDVVVGMGGNPDDVIESHAGVTITGDEYAMSYDPTLPTIIVPVYLVSMTPGGDIVNTRTISTSGQYSSIDLGNSNVLTIDEPVSLYITGDITLGNSAEIRIGGGSDTDNDASLTIYLAGDIEGKNASGFNNVTTDATRLSVYCLDSCESIIFKNSSDFCGAIYAPSASIELKNDADVYGSIIGESFILKNSATVYYDAALRNRSVDDEATRFTIHRWTEQ